MKLLNIGFMKTGLTTDDLNFNLIDTGEGPIDTGSDPVRGRVAGESDNHYAITIDFSFHWR